mmetsp:Transcript_30518/g.93326  ORF Transcript_30518/g.93326 Transcript_30518/m.93326 type:complete len:126 (-) Transcript_30518:390-767(-)
MHRAHHARRCRCSRVRAASGPRRGVALAQSVGAGQSGEERQVSGDRDGSIGTNTRPSLSGKLLLSQCQRDDGVWVAGVPGLATSALGDALAWGVGSGGRVSRAGRRSQDRAFSVARFDTSLRSAS